MKIAVCSDLHLEFGDLDLVNDEQADVLVLGGDIFIATELSEFAYDASTAIVSATDVLVPGAIPMTNGTPAGKLTNGVAV